MQDRFKFRIPMFTDKGTFMEFQYFEVGDFIECTLWGTNGKPQQCTGLKDKNGKLIYEGDYIKNLKTNTIYKVFWKDKATCFMLKSTIFGGVVSTYMMFEEYPNDLEVIGNIYENTELLEDMQWPLKTI